LDGPLRFELGWPEQEHWAIRALPIVPAGLSACVFRAGICPRRKGAWGEEANAYVPKATCRCIFTTGGIYILYLPSNTTIKKIVYLASAALLFSIGQIFNYVISTHLCQASNGKINGALFETFFTLLSVLMVWVFWSSITEDDWPLPVGGGGGYN
jgi:hypothetical protein